MVLLTEKRIRLRRGECKRVVIGTATVVEVCKIGDDVISLRLGRFRLRR